MKYPNLSNNQLKVIYAILGAIIFNPQTVLVVAISWYLVKDNLLD